MHFETLPRRAGIFPFQRKEPHEIRRKFWRWKVSVTVWVRQLASTHTARTIRPQLTKLPALCLFGRTPRLQAQTRKGVIAGVLLSLIPSRDLRWNVAKDRSEENGYGHMEAFLGDSSVGMFPLLLIEIGRAVCCVLVFFFLFFFLFEYVVQHQFA